MKVRININSELWERFRSKVNQDNLVLDEVVPQVFEKAVRDYLEPCVPIEPQIEIKPPTLKDSPLREEVVESYRAIARDALSDLPIIDRITPPKPPPTTAPTKRCELCDLPTERLFSVTGKKVCYACWKQAITAPSIELSNPKP